MDEEPTGLDWLFHEVGRRRLIPAAGIYVVVCWFIVQLLATASPHLDWPDWIVRVAMALTFAGLPAVLGIAWILGGGIGAVEDERTGPGVGAPGGGPGPSTVTATSGAAAGHRTPSPDGVGSGTHAPLRGPGTRTLLIMVLAFMGGALWAYRTWGRDTPSPPDPVVSLDPDVTRRAVAVLPFENLSGQPEEAYFSLGVGEEIRSALARVPELDVSSRTSTHRLAERAMSIREIAGELQVGSVLEGSVRRAGDRLRVTVRLVDTRTDEQLWSETFDRTLDVDNLFAVEAEIARSVATALEVTLGPERRLLGPAPVSLEAHDLYLLGLHHWNRRTAADLERAEDLFEAAAAQDPDYALAHAGLANTRVLLPLYADVPSRTAMPEARAAASRALALDSALAEAHAALAFVKTTHEWDWTGAEESFRKALSVDPSYATGHEWYGLLLDATGRHAEARVALERALELDPLSLIINEVLGNHFLFTGDHDAATDQLLRTLELDPDFPLALQFLAETHLLAGRHDDALRVLEHWARVTGTPVEPWAAVVAGVEDPRRRDDAVAALSRMGDAGVLPPYRLAQHYALVGAPEPALDALERAFTEKDFLLYLVAVDPAFAPFRAEPRFERILAGMGLAPAP